MLGFHGCDESVRDALVNHPNQIKKSQELFDWLGHGFYIWENNYQRAHQWAVDKKARGSLITPSVVGVVYQLDNCLDFTDSAFIDLLYYFHSSMKDDLRIANKTLPQNKDIANDKFHDMIIRELDCAVIEYMHQKIEEEINQNILTTGYSDLKRFDTAGGVFTEGGPAFEGAGIQTKNHIQICIRNLNCIKGIIIPRQDTPFP